MAKPDDDNRSNQLNPNHDAYWQSRGHDERPDDLGRARRGLRGEESPRPARCRY